MKKIIRIFGFLFLIISTLLLSYIFSKSVILFEDNNFYYYKSYLSISICLFLLSIIFFFLNYEIKKYIVIIISSISFSLYLGEAYFTYYKHWVNIEFEYLEDIKTYETKTNIKYDKRNRFEIYNDLKNQKNISLLFGSGNFLEENSNLIPFSSKSNSRVIACNENGYYSIFESDRYGFNNPNKIWDKESIDYVLIGDSFTHGHCVNRPNDVTSVLRKLSGKTLLNLGHPGNGPLSTYAQINEYLTPKMKNILWLYFEGEGHFRLEEELKSQLLIKYLKNKNFKQNLKSKQKEIDKLIESYINIAIGERKIISQKKILNFIKLSNLRKNIYSQVQPIIKMPSEFEKILELTKNKIEENNSKLYFVYLPSFYRYKFENHNFTENYEYIKKIVKEMEIPFVDIHKNVFEKEVEPLKLFPFEKNGHYNQLGYKKIAEEIFRSVIIKDDS